MTVLQGLQKTFHPKKENRSEKEMEEKRRERKGGRGRGKEGGRKWKKNLTSSKEKMIPLSAYLQELTQLSLWFPDSAGERTRDWLV